MTAKLNYKQLGDYIRQIDIRNTDLSVKKLLGVSNNKLFIPSIANTIGTDFSSYKIVKHNQFAYSPVTSRNGDKVSIALFEEDICIISSSYLVFEIIDENVLKPEYLILWLKRPEFDRYARFKSHGSVREIFDWDELCNVELPIPSYEKQNKIVREYRAISNRIALKQRINDNLQKTINAIFEKFYSLECQDEVPLLNLCDCSSSKRVFSDEYVAQGIPFYRGGEITLKQNGKPITEPLYISCEHYRQLKSKYGVPKRNDILVTAVGTIGNSYLVEDENFYFKDGNIIWLHNFIHPEYSYYIYDFMQSPEFQEKLEGICIGSTQTALTIIALSQMRLKRPDNAKLNEYANKSIAIRRSIQKNQNELLKLYEILQVLLSTISRR